LNLPPDFTQTILELNGEAGRAWLNALPGLIADCERRWSLHALPPFDLSYNYVAPAVRADGTPAVLKLGPLSPELLSEIAALRACEGRGMVLLLESDPEWGAMVLERLRPGVTLVALEDDVQATAIAARVMRQLWRPAPPNPVFPTVHQWAAGMTRLRGRFAGGTGPLPAGLVDMAESLFAELLGSMAGPVLLHGDLHHWNILSSDRQPWLAIDPKGLLGEPAYEVGALLRNPLPGLLDQPDPGRVLARRVDQLSAELGLDRRRVAGWGMAQAMLSAWWSIEDHGHGWEEAVHCADLLAQLL
jgi:streptomycin 6-kinase